MLNATLDLVVENGIVVLGDGRYRLAVGVKDGKVAMLAPEELMPPARRRIDARGNFVLPGIVDSEAHPGCYVPFEQDIRSESRAAACAGVTSWGVQAPVTRLGTTPFKEVVKRSDVVSFHSAFPSARRVLDNDSHVDAYLTYMLETDEQAREIPEYAEQHGVTSFKLYLQTRGLRGMPDDDDNNWPSRRAGLGHGIDDGTVYLTMEQTARLGYPGMVHIHPENWEIARIFEERLRASGRTDFGAWTDRSPDFLEAQHIRAYAYMAKQTPGRAPLYLQHCTTELSFQEVAKARAEGVELYAQTGPAWLWAQPEDGWRINVPLRRRENIEALWRALAEGIVDVVGSDHVVGWEPASHEEMFNANIWDCRTGFSRVELFLPVLLSEGVNKGRISMERLVQVSCENPAKTSGLWGKKGSLLPGYDADMVIVDAGREVTVGKEHINTRSGWSIMEGHEFTGWPIMTILRGEVTAEWADDSPGMRPVGDPRGKFLPRTLKDRARAFEVTEPTRVSRDDRWSTADMHRPGFSPETLPAPPVANGARGEGIAR
ncbi:MULTISPECIES: dihydroorotase [Streptomyces]|uniref:dihydroorotase n=1 Tax=Streptomyces TaxID=1883 RepID=UPI000241B6A7|nr:MULTISPECIES: amidohydrolase family protein [Streptomyces]EHM24888.1 amidohydrolase [Streptomyces sp. W007]MCX4483279.1 amidohydrolase family protein [Streptomyces anulatus]MCX4516950.1 amidohydrolase family protein [Streptomyces anulatus]MCX4599780.1 amidohydrolase family protein [Streptomyces anulatus]WSI76252.1 amidohydrolase family protein [Streptomyces anulatus]